MVFFINFYLNGVKPVHKKVDSVYANVFVAGVYLHLLKVYQLILAINYVNFNLVLVIIMHQKVELQKVLS